MDLLYVEPWLGGSHKRWIEGYRRHSALQVESIGLAPRHWKWRMVGAAAVLAQQLVDRGLRPKAILASDMLHLPSFLGHVWALEPEALLRGTSRIPVHLYMHENQLTHPTSPKDRSPSKDGIPAWINVDSCRAADRVWFNSRYHFDAFFSALPAFLSALPERGGMGQDALDALKKKSAVLPMGMDWPHQNQGAMRQAARLKNEQLDRQLPASRTWHEEDPILLWNHRWTFDKAPDRFAQALIELAPKQRFRLVLTGAEGGDAALKAWRTRLADVLGQRLLHAGKLSPEAYAQWLRKADLLAVCAEHDFFGQSVVESLHAGLVPLLPKRLAYPEHLPDQWSSRVFYEPGQFHKRLEDLLAQWPQALEAHARDYPALNAHLDARYGWSALWPLYDAAFGTDKTG